MKKTTWDKILKIVIAVASAVLGALSAHCNLSHVHRAFLPDEDF